MDLFEARAEEERKRHEPLASRMRPRQLDEYIGQDHILGPGRLLRRAIQLDQLRSLIFYGPPGTGKTTLAQVIANTTRCSFRSINAVLAGVADLRLAIEAAKQLLSLEGRRTLLFVDEVHRFNKAQQDALLPHVENGLITLIGATTQNPYFEVNAALVSRSRIFELRPLTPDELCRIAQQALSTPERGYGGRQIHLEEAALTHLVDTASGDARSLLNALELAVETTAPGPDGLVRLTLEVCEESIQKKALLYDKDGDVHYDAISAFIKSVRGSDPDAALYWMARMIAAGEDPKFLFRRMLILASEDVGLADPNALVQVTSAWQAYEMVGLPEGRFHLSQACLYLCLAPKSNTTLAFFDALKTVEKEVSGEVPNALKDGSRDGAHFGHGKGYLYPHSFQEHWVAQEYLPTSLRGKIFYQPSNRGWESLQRTELQRRREIVLAKASQALHSRQVFEERDLEDDRPLLEQVRTLMFPADLVLRDQAALIVPAGHLFILLEALRRFPLMSVITASCRPEEEEFLRSHLPSGIDPLLVNWDATESWKSRELSSPIYDVFWSWEAREKGPEAFLTFFAALRQAASSEAHLYAGWKDRLKGPFLSELLPDEKDLQSAERAWRDDISKQWPGEALFASVESRTAWKLDRLVRSEIPSERRITSEMIAIWFRPESESFGSRMTAAFGEDFSARIHQRFQNEVAGKKVVWKQAILWTEWKAT